jgi:D-arabinose 1-dehydrogenase-like Zn-dependent alcohol dehydrogenase
MQLAADGRIRLDAAMGGRFSLESAGDAYRLLSAGQITGRAVVVM